MLYHISPGERQDQLGHGARRDLPRLGCCRCWFDHEATAGGQPLGDDAVVLRPHLRRFFVLVGRPWTQVDVFARERVTTPRLLGL
jgi:hypothetical protein